MTTISDLNDKWAAYAGPGGWNDPCMLEVGNGGMTYQEYRANFTIWALMKTPFLFREGKFILQGQMVVVRFFHLAPLAYFGDATRFKARTLLQVWAGTLSGRRLAVALWKRCSKAATITTIWDVLGLDFKSVTIRDLWQDFNIYGETNWRVNKENAQRHLLLK